MPVAQNRSRPLLVVLFVIYLVLLAWAILWKFEIPYIGRAAGYARPIKLLPFLPSGDDGPSNPLEVLGNILLFIPFGLYLGSLARSWRWWMLTAVFLGASLLLEITQHLLSTGSFDTSDLISNTAGGVAGLGLLAVARRCFGSRLPSIGIRMGLIGTALSLVAIAILFASPLRYGPQQDVIVHRHATGEPSFAAYHRMCPPSPFRPRQAPDSTPTTSRPRCVFWPS